MSDYISRDSIRQKLWNKSYTDPNDATEVCVIINIEPSADVRENIHGTWEEWKGSRYPRLPICSNCKMGFSFNFKKFNFCPNCGADMRGE